MIDLKNKYTWFIFRCLQNNKYLIAFKLMEELKPCHVQTPSALHEWSDKLNFFDKYWWMHGNDTLFSREDISRLLFVFI